VSDGTATVSLPAFNLEVVALGNGTATVSWTAPTQNSDGTALADLAGYRIVYGRSADQLEQSTTVSNPGLTSLTISNLSTGTWYFGVIAVNAAGSESNVSNVATKLIVL
jgi:hypothetical protein